jgi:hypothetical protein
MYATVNKIAHKFNIYPFLNNIVYFTKRTFVKKTSYPIISILLFILVIILNSIQYSNNDEYLQNKIKESISTDKNKLSLQNSLLYLYDFIGINGFLTEGLVHILFYILTYVCLSLIELNIGHISLLFLLFIGIMFHVVSKFFNLAICNNELSFSSNRLISGSYCCGSFVLYMSLGCVLFLIQKNINNWILRSFILLVILLVWILILLYDYNTIYKYKNNPQKICNSINYHAANFVFGIFCGMALAN